MVREAAARAAAMEAARAAAERVAEMAEMTEAVVKAEDEMTVALKDGRGCYLKEKMVEEEKVVVAMVVTNGGDKCRLRWHAVAEAAEVGAAVVRDGEHVAAGMVAQMV